MRVVIYPFPSQQDKSSGEFLLRTCGACKQLAFIADRLEALGHCVTVVLPPGDHPFRCAVVRTYMPVGNALLRMHWDMRELQRLFADADLALCNHELLPIPLRALFPNLRIVQMTSVRPEPLDLFKAAWRCSDLVAVQGAYAARQVRMLTRTPVSVWPLAYDAEQLPQQERGGDGAVFLQRCSANNCTHHEEALASEVDFTYTDVTGYLRRLHPGLKYTTPNTYLSTLRSSAVAVSLYASWYGGLSVREAVRCGCAPVVLRDSGYIELVGEGWPCFAEPTPQGIAAAVRTALAGVDCSVPMANAALESYQVGWAQVRRDLCS
jgi:hypothetical protein